jgi:hypothetical protein
MSGDLDSAISQLSMRNVGYPGASASSGFSALAMSQADHQQRRHRAGWCRGDEHQGEFGGEACTGLDSEGFLGAGQRGAREGWEGPSLVGSDMFMGVPVLADWWLYGGLAAAGRWQYRSFAWGVFLLPPLWGGGAARPMSRWGSLVAGWGPHPASMRAEVALP